MHLHVVEDGVSVVVDGSDDEAACPLPINKHLSHKLTFTCSHGLVLLTDLSKHVTY